MSEQDILKQKLIDGLYTLANQHPTVSHSGPRPSLHLIRRLGLGPTIEHTTATPEEPNDLVNDLLTYLMLLHKWNQAYNLTAVRDLDTMVSRHVLDSLAILSWVRGHRVLDVGTGAGLPGIPLALARPDLQVVLLDSNGKKTRFLQEVKRVLSLSNVEIVQSRVENYRPAQGFDTVMSRAFSSLQDMLDWTGHLVAPDGIWLAMKGQRPDTELQTIHHRYQVETYAVVGVEGERCCVIVENEGNKHGENYSDS